MINKKKVRNDKEEIASLTENALKKKKFRKIALQKINLGTKPINISFPKYEFLEYTNLSESKKKRIKIFSIIAVVIIIMIVLLILMGKFHHQNNNELSDNNNLVENINQNSTLNFTKTSSFSSSGNRNISSPSVSSGRKRSSQK